MLIDLLLLSTGAFSGSVWPRTEDVRLGTHYGVAGAETGLLTTGNYDNYPSPPAMTQPSMTLSSSVPGTLWLQSSAPGNLKLSSSVSMAVNLTSGVF